VQLTFHSNYLSITQFEAIDLPQLSVVTGVNGAGKSHLLRAIAEGHVTVGDIQKDEIVLFTNENFRLDNQSELTTDNAIQDRYGAWDLLNQTQNYNLIGNLRSFREQLGEAAMRIRTAATESDKAIWKLTTEDGLSDADFEQLQIYKRNVQSFIVNHQQLRGNHQALSILGLCKKAENFIDDLSRYQFYDLYEPRQLKENFLPNQLTLAFTDYYSKLEENDYRRFRNETLGENHRVVTPDEFTKRHGPKPWDVINQVLSQLGTVPYRINSPDGLTRFDRFQAKLIHQRDDTICPQFNDLSSGEKVLLALVASVYKGSSDKNFPKLLLLDEIDASLHPSMMQNMLSIVNEVFIKSGVVTILVTHSPTTIAISPAESIYVMYQSGSKRIEHRSRADALEVLTEGFVTLDKGLTLLDEVARTKVSIVTEGKNVDFVRRALELSAIRGVEVISGVEDRTGTNQLRTLYDFFSKLPHENRVVIAWDCDADKYRNLESINNTYPYVFQRNESNTIATKGIENLFRTSLLEGFKKEIHFSDGRMKVEFDESQKGAFARFVLDRGESSDFELFSGFIEFVRGVADEQATRSHT
jgi:ABC-type branched-subunit amino acid transport system ATPase component